MNKGELMLPESSSWTLWMMCAGAFHNPGSINGNGGGGRADELPTFTSIDDEEKVITVCFRLRFNIRTVRDRSFLLGSTVAMIMKLIKLANRDEANARIFGVLCSRNEVLTREMDLTSSCTFYVALPPLTRSFSRLTNVDDSNTCHDESLRHIQAYHKNKIQPLKHFTQKHRQ